MERVLITGGTGFVGSNFVYKFLELGHEVHLIVRENSNLKRIVPIMDKVVLHAVDLFSEQDVEKCVKKIQPAIILHFAAYGAYPARQKETRETIDTNILATVNLLHACNKISFKCLINAGSSSEYGEKDHPMMEEELAEPNSLYGVTKVASTLYCSYFAKKFDLPIVTARLFSPYGYFDNRNRLMPSIISSALSGKVFNAPSPSPVRDFIFIEDVMSVYLKIIANANSIKGQVFNIASGVQYSIGEIISIVEEITNRKINVVYGGVGIHQHEPKMWVADISKIQKILNWTPQTTLKEGLQMNIEWFLKHPTLYE